MIPDRDERGQSATRGSERGQSATRGVRSCSLRNGSDLTPRVAGRSLRLSARPNPPERSLAKNIQWPSGEKAGTKSLDVELIVDPRFIGVPQGSFTDARWETQMSSDPTPPVRPL
jgi:hypothetical protein